jgi:hypothetical protein
MEQLEICEGEPFIPHDVAVMVIRQDMPLVKAWRLYKGLTVDEVADLAGLKTDDVIKIESADNQLSYSLEKVSLVLNLDIEQIVDF